MGGIEDKDTSNEQPAPELYYKTELVKAYQKDYDEFMWISNGSITEYKQLTKLSLNDYYSLMKYVIDKNRELEQRHNEIINSQQNGR